jgi:prephenate dehydrogenase
MIQRLCIIGVGLIGGSLARALRAAGACREIVGAGRDPMRLQQAIDLGVIDCFETDLAVAVKGADMVMVSVPVGTMATVFSALKGRLADNAVLTDAGSTKGSVIATLQDVFGEVPDCFVPGHPIAGTEQNGVGASFPELYQGRRVILTPLQHTNRSAIDRVRHMWKATGATVTEMDAKHHDEVMAATSHLPHVLAFALVESLARLQDKQEIFEYAAGGFRDFTRIASSDPVMWRDICLANGDAILAMIERYCGDLQSLAGAVREHDGDKLLEIFSTAKAARDSFVDTP